MRRNLRFVLRSLGLASVTAFMTVLLLVGALPALLLGRWVAWRSWVMRRWARGAARCMGIRIETEGEPPRGAYLLVSNHLGYADIPVLASQTGCRFVSKAEVRRWPVIGPLSRLAGTVFVNRERRRDVVRVGGEIGAALDQGSGLVLFPEGTSTAGARVDPFRSSLLQPVAAAELPVHFACLAYRTPDGELPAHLSVAWWGDMSLAPHLLELLRLPRIEAKLRFGDHPLQDADRKRLAESLHAAVSDKFEPMVDEVPSLPVQD